MYAGTWPIRSAIGTWRAYDTHSAYDVATSREAKLLAPPRENAVSWENGHRGRRSGVDLCAGLEEWKKASGYHGRSIGENAMYRLKQLFGDTLVSPVFEIQVTELGLHRGDECHDLSGHADLGTGTGSVARLESRLELISN